MRRVGVGVAWGLAVASAMAVLLLAARIITDVEPAVIRPAPSADEQGEAPVVVTPARPQARLSSPRDRRERAGVSGGSTQPSAVLVSTRPGSSAPTETPTSSGGDPGSGGGGNSGTPPSDGNGGPQPGGNGGNGNGGNPPNPGGGGSGGEDDDEGEEDDDEDEDRGHGEDEDDGGEDDDEEDDEEDDD